MRDFKKLLVWNKAHKFVLEIYKFTMNFPKEELYGITSQLRRATISIPNNIAEGCGRKSKKELLHFLNIAMGSASEAEYLILLSNDLNFLGNNYNTLQESLVEIRKMLNAFMSTIESDLRSKTELTAKC